MFKKLLFIAIIAFSITSLVAQDKKFSVQLNTGYTFLSGKKFDKLGEGDKYALGTVSNGLIPLELEARFRPISKFAINLAYAYNFSLPYSLDRPGEELGIAVKLKNTVPSHSIRIGGLYYFATEKFKPYAGLDLGVLLSQWNMKAEADGTSATTKTKMFTNLSIRPKVGFEYDLPANLFLNVVVYYDALIPMSDVKNSDGEVMIPKSEQTATHGVGVNVGVGIRF